MKLAEINYCAQCPHSGQLNKYWICNFYPSEPNQFDAALTEIPDWCPLPDAEETK